MTEQVFETREETESLEAGRKLAEQLTLPAILLLEGELGAGKTTLTRGIAEGLGLQDSTVVRSPTFSLVNEYLAKKAKIYHIDLYRLDTLKDLYSIGLEEILEEEAVIIIEWAEKLLLPVDHVTRIQIKVLPDQSRRITVKKQAS